MHPSASAPTCLVLMSLAASLCVSVCVSLCAQVVLDEYEDGDVVWVHDYHLMLLPTMLRQARPSMKIGFFFHTPFPSSEIYRVIPSRDELLYGVLSSNLLGFHTHDYSRHFQSAATRIIGALCSNEQITLNGALSQLGTFPIGIDPTRFLEALATPGVQRHMDDLRAQFGGKRVLLGIDRLDYIKASSTCNECTTHSAMHPLH